MRGAGRTLFGKDRFGGLNKKASGAWSAAADCSYLEEFGPGVPSALTIPSGKEVPDGLSGRWNVRRKHVIKAAVLTDDHDYVPDGRCCLRMTGRRLSNGESRRS